MKGNHYGNALLVELLIVVLFFMLSSTVLLQLFASARNQGAKAETLTEATVLAQNIADTLYASDEAETALAGMGFSSDGDRWILPGEKLTASVDFTREVTEAGIMNRYSIRVLSGEKILITLPGARYEENAA